MASPRLDRRDLIETLVMNARGVPTHVQDSPVLPDVWIAHGLARRFASASERARAQRPPEPDGAPAGTVAHLLAVNEGHSPSAAAAWLEKSLKRGPGGSQSSGRKPPQAARAQRARVAWNDATVTATLTLDELVALVLPMTPWWHRELMRWPGAAQRREHPLTTSSGRSAVRSELIDEIALIEDPTRLTPPPKKLPDALVWLVRLVGHMRLMNDPGEPYEPTAQTADAIVASCFDLFDAWEGAMAPRNLDARFVIWNVHRARKATPTMYRSQRTIKADVARTSFQVTGRGIRWAVLDSGIDATHMAFRERWASGEAKPAYEETTGRLQSRVVETYDFTRFDELMALRSLNQQSARASFAPDASDDEWEGILSAIRGGHPLRWRSLVPALRIKHERGSYPTGGGEIRHHGTHVAGVLGANWLPNDDEEDVLDPEDERIRVGMCPEIELVDVRVLDAAGAGREFNICAAMQFLRWYNESQRRIAIHGANLSLAVKHEVASFACGRTPVCDEASRLMLSGVLVVAAAGNRGRARYLTTQGDEDEGYRNVSITDPGNAELVLTVGSTHREHAHRYGVSYFSSRGPTGDGRTKPDLVAPGEKIVAPIPHGDELRLTGTSQAAPHVSAAAAMLMERHRELIGEPQKVKQLLIDTAVDLGRERHFQGAGLVDVFAALRRY